MIPELTADKIALFSLAVAIFSALVALASVWISAQSAAAAKQSADAATRTFRRSAIRDLLGSCQEIIDNERAIHSLADRAASARHDLSRFNGAVGGDRTKIFIDAIEKFREDASKLANKAKRISRDSTTLHNTSDQEVDVSFFELEKTRGEICAIRSELERDLAGILAENHQHRDKILGQ
jgi:type II secretory pathway pseudopilin PulG